MLFLSFIAFPVLSPGAALLWIEGDGVVVMEAEKGTPETNEHWAVRTDVADYRGDGFIRWEGEDYLKNDTHGRLAYRFYLQEGGTYGMRLISFHDPASRGKRADEENDCWTNVDLSDPNRFVKTYRNGILAGRPWSERTQWVLHVNGRDEFPNATYVLEAGEHTFRLAARAENLMIDRIILFRMETDSDTVDINAPESLISGITDEK